MTIAEFIAKYNTAGTGLFKTGQSRGIGSDDMRTFVTDITTLTDLPSQALASDEVDTSGATLTLDFNGSKHRLFVGSASFATSKTIALSNSTNALIFTFSFEISNVAATLIFPSTFTMSDPRWTDSTHTLNLNPDTGKFKLKAEYNGTDWYMELFGPYP